MNLRRSICFVEPNGVYAGNLGNWVFKYTTHIALPKQSRLKFDILSQGRPIDWQAPQAASKDKSNMIWAETNDGKVLSAKEVNVKGSIVPQYEFVLPVDVKAGEQIKICLGSPLKEHVSKKGNRAQISTQRRRPFHLYVDPKGKGEYKDPDVFLLDIKGNTLSTIKVITPSIVVKNKRFDIILRFEDAFGNLTNNAEEGTLIELTYEHLRDSLSWKLFVPETGFITLPNLYFNEQGIYKIRLLNTKTGEVYFSPPIKCFADTLLNLHWGLFHAESTKYDSSENIDTCLRSMRDEVALHFFASSSFESEEETSDAAWKKIGSQISEANEDNRFNTFLGFQWNGSSEEEGLRQFIYLKDSKPLLRKKESKYNTLKKIYKSHLSKDLLAIPCFTMGKGTEFDFKDFDPEFERVVEIYNAWGSSECSKKEGNPRPIQGNGKKGASEYSDGSIRQALQKGHRFGFVAGGLDDRGVYSSFYENQQTQYSAGLTAILISKEQTRENLFQALQARQCYATTGERIILGFSLAGQNMGGELSTKLKPGLALNRHLTGYIAGTSLLKEINIIRNGKVIHSYEPNHYFFEFAYDDHHPVQSLTINDAEGRVPFIYYYIRVIQDDGHLAWSSPIWVDCPEVSPQAPPKKKK